VTDNDAVHDYNRDQQITELQLQNKKLVAMNAALLHSLEIRIREMTVLVEQMKEQLQGEWTGDKMKKIDNTLEIALEHIWSASNEIDRLHIYKDAIHRMCSVRYEDVDDYIRIAKQAVADYEGRDEEEST